MSYYDDPVRAWVWYWRFMQSGLGPDVHQARTVTAPTEVFIYA